jgi:mono/diheme cytochrome c family protein
MMPQVLKPLRWLFPLVVAALALSACGMNLSGEPDIVSEVEVQSPPTATGVLSAEIPAVPLSGTEQAAAPDATAAGGGETALTGDFSRGTQLYLQECASCHGADAGVGPSLSAMKDEAGNRVAGLSAEDYLHQSIVDPGAFIVEGYDDIMPKDFGQKLSEQDVADLVTFIMDFTPQAMMDAANAAQNGEQGGAQGTSPTSDPHAALTASPEANSSDPHAVLTSSPSAATGTLTVRGKLIQGTDGGDAIPADQPVELYAVDPHGTIVGIYDTACDGDGAYTFEDVASGEGFLYLVSTTYADVPQGIQTPAIQGDETEVNADITVYERTSDRGSVAISMARMLVNYAPINEFGLEVRLDLELINTGDKIVATDEMGDRGWPISVNVELPVGAFFIQPMQSEGSNRYQVQLTDDQIPIVQDTWPLRPDQRHTITILYYLPYESEAVIDQSFGFPVMDASVLLPNDTVEFESDQFDTSGEFRYHVLSGGLRVEELSPSENVSDDDHTLIKAYDLLQPVGADQQVVFTLKGRPTYTVDVMNPNAQTTNDGTNPLVYLFGGAGLAVILMGGVLWWRQRKTAPAAPVVHGHWTLPGSRATKDELLQALAALDDAYAAGEVDEETYLDARDALKERLIPLVDDDNA